MKKRSLIKLIALITVVAAAAAVLSGCIVSYSEEKDYSQVILEVNPVEITYEVPMYFDYLDPDGEPVTNHVKLDDGDDNPAYVAEVPTDENGVVQTVRYANDGTVIKKPVVENHAIKYTDETNTVSDYYAVVYRVGSNDEVTAAEYRYDGFIRIGENGSVRAALWHDVVTGETYYGPLSYMNSQPTNENYVPPAPDTDDLIDTALPVIYYEAYNASSEVNFTWEKRTLVYETATYTSEKYE